MTPPETPSHLLIVEDDLALQGALQQVLLEQGYVATAASSLEEALRLVHRQPFDLILTELFTPADQETLAFLLPLQSLSHAIPIVIVDTCLPASDVSQQGFHKLLSKPFGWDELITAVAEGLNHPFRPVQLPQAAVAQRYFAAMSHKDSEAQVALCTEEVRMYPWIVPFYPAARPVTGRGDARVYLQGMMQYANTVQAELAQVKLYPCPHGVAARLLVQWYEPMGAVQQQMVGACLTITEEGKISQVGLPIQDEHLQTLLGR